MKIIIAGGRYFNDYEKLCEVCDYMLQNQTEIEIVSGTTRGVDILGEKYVKEKGYLIKQFPPNWGLYGNSAGPKRNLEMVVYADSLIVFWDGKSKGSKNMVELAEKNGLKTKIVRYE